MSQEIAHLPPSVQDVLSEYPDFLNNIKWLRRVCGSPDENADGEILRVLLVWVENALSGSLPLMDGDDWRRVADFLQVVKSNYPQDRETLLYQLRDYNLVGRGGPLLTPSDSNPIPAAHSLIDDIGNARRSMQTSLSGVSDAQRQVVEAAEEGQATISHAVQQIEDASANADSEIDLRLEDLKNRYGATVGAALGGSYEASAKAEKDLMERHTKSARIVQAAATMWAIVIAIVKLTGIGPDGLEGHLASAPLLGGPVAILIYFASTETHAARVHRHNHARWLGLSLQLKSLRPYIDDLASRTQLPEGETEVAWTESLLEEVSSKIFKGDIGPYEPPPRSPRSLRLRAK